MTLLAPPRRAWQPLLAAHHPLSGCAEAIAHDIARHAPPGSESTVRHHDLAQGSAGLAVLFAHLARALGSATYRELAVEYANACVDAAAASTRIDLFSGLAGVAWATSHTANVLDVGRHADTSDSTAGGPTGDLPTSGDVDDASDDASDDALGEVLQASLADDRWRGHYDLVSGLVGLGVFALQRHSRPWAAPLLAAIVERLWNWAEICPRGARWLTPVRLLPDWQRTTFPNGHYNVGLAHGSPGVVAMLSHAVSVLPDSPRTRELLTLAARWLADEAMRDPAKSIRAYFGPGANQQPSGRVAWCYGDPGAAVALLSGARALGDAGLEQVALHVAHRAARRDIAGSGAVDAGFCHGAAGVAHVFNRLYQATGDDTIRQAAIDWASSILTFRRAENVLAGFYRYLKDPATGTVAYLDEPSVLEGAAGIALVTLSLFHAQEPSWDHWLLCHVAGGAANEPSPSSAQAS